MALPLAILGLPLLIPAVQQPLYEWMGHHREAAHHVGEQIHSVKEALHHASESNAHLHILVQKYGYLNIGAWTFRFVFYFFVLWHIARTLRSKSVKQDMDGDIKHTISARAFCCRWMLFYALTVTFAAVDWLMTLDYSWFSTMWGVYIFAGCAMGIHGADHFVGNMASWLGLP